MKIIGYITVTIVLTIYGTLMNGWALSQLWSWFIVKTFELPALTIPEAIGICLVVRFMTSQFDGKNCKNDEYLLSLIKSAFISTLKPLVSLGMGAIVRLWL